LHVWFTGTGEDVEAVLARLQAQSAENAALKERQAKASSDLQVTHCLHTFAPKIPSPVFFLQFAFPLPHSEKANSI